MAKRKKIPFIKNLNQSWASFALWAIIVVVLGLLVANFLSKKAPEIGPEEQSAKTEDVTKISRDYTVQEGDSLSKISEKIYGTQEMWPVLAKVNKVENPNIIWVDAKFNIPSKVDAEKMAKDMAVTSYQVKEGDTLFAISEQVYGNGASWRTIASANHVGYLANGNPLIFSGTTLVIPQ